MTVKQFNILNETLKSIDEDGELYIKGIANTGERDLVGDVITEQALQEIAEQAVNRNLHFNHAGHFDNTLSELTESIIGVITESEVTSEGVEITARILPKHADNIRYLLDNGVRLGLSVSGQAHYEENSWEQIESWDLTEISLTAMPCDQGTMGTVEISKSFTDFIKSVPTNNEEDDDDKSINDGSDKMADDGITKEDVIELINTAFNEKEEELLETVRKENEQKFDELLARIEALENQKDDDDSGDDDNNPDAGADSDADDGKNIDELVNKKVEETLSTIFKGVRTPEFQYMQEQKSTPDEDDDEDGVNEKKSYTAQEIAEAIVGRNM